MSDRLFRFSPHSIAAAARRLAGQVGSKIGFLVRPSAQPMLVPADAGEVDRILLGLVLIAREAAGAGTAITIETEIHKVLPAAAGGRPGSGPYVRLTAGAG